MRPFAYERPTAIADALALLDPSGDGAAGDGARPLAGGTDLLTLIKGEIAAPTRLVDLKRLAELDDSIALDDGGLTLGALTTLAAIERHALVLEQAPALAEAAAAAATPQLRNMATLGGNLLQRPRCWYFRNRLFDCWLKGGDACPARDGENGLHALFGSDASPCVAVHPSDLAPALLALDAELRLRGPRGERTLPLTDFFALPDDDRRRENTLVPDELIVAVRLPTPLATTKSTYLKAMDRKVWAFALVGVAASLGVESGRIATARVVLSGVAPIPWRAEAAERLLIGAAPSEALFARATEAALLDAAPLAHNGYKVPLAEALVRRALAAVTPA